MQDFFTLLLLMLGWHYLADYPLQGDFLAKAKNHLAPLPGTPWYQALLAHSSIHALGVFILTGSLLLFALELLCHSLIDWLKCDKAISFNQDQMLHILCKVLWAGIALTSTIP